MERIKSFCSQFNIDTYEIHEYQYADFLNGNITYEDILVNRLDYEALKNGATFELYRYDYSELWDNLEKSCDEMIGFLEDRILEIGKTEIPITYIKRRQEKIYGLIDSYLAEYYIKGVVKDADIDDSFVFCSSNLHPRAELEATLHTFHTDVLKPKIDNLVAAYENPCIQNTQKNEDATPDKKDITPFRDHLVCDEQKKDEIIERLRPLFQGAKGKTASIILIALHEAKLIGLSARNKQPIYDAVNDCFGLTLTNQSYQRYITSDNSGMKWNIITAGEIQQIVDILNK